LRHGALMRIVRETLVDQERKEVMAPALRMGPKFACGIALLTAICAAAPVNAAQELGTWSVAAQMTAARTEIGGVALNGKIYVAGGQEMGRPDSTLFQVFDLRPRRGRISLRCPEGIARGLTVLDGKIYIYVAGGSPGGPQRSGESVRRLRSCSQ